MTRYYYIPMVIGGQFDEIAVNNGQVEEAQINSQLDRQISKIFCVDK